MYDVAVIGYGPVGMATAALLGRAGHRVVVLERYDSLYNLPRAAIFDDETMRTFALLGIAESLLPKLHIQRTYEWRNGEGELLIEHEFAETGRSGWAEWYMMYQPDLEDALDGVCRSLPGVEVRFGSRVTGLQDSGAGVRVQLDGGAGEADGPVEARYVVACDGGNSFTRQWLGIGQDDYGFSEPWMVCDFKLTEPVELPMAQQVCNPAQPQSIISIGPGHHRFSFMLDAEESFAAESRPELVWQRVKPYLRQEQAELIRVATYTFLSRVAHQWRTGRVLLAGDAAHQMPPFLGQGMCSGIRDAQNIAFKLDAVLRGRADDGLLDTYQSEREPHVRAVIEKGIELGRIQTLRDPAKAAERDRQYIERRRGGHHSEKIRFPGLGPGLLADGDTPASGQLMVQGRLLRGDRTARFDEHFGHGFQLVLHERLHRALSPGLLDQARAIGLGVAVVGTGTEITQSTQSSTEAAIDTDGTYMRWFDAHACAAVLVRPDFYVFGTADTAAATEALVADLAARLGSGISSSPSPLTTAQA